MTTRPTEAAPDAATLTRWNEEGRHAEVLAAVLPSAADADEAALEAGREAALRLAAYDDALALNAVLGARLAARDTTPLERARVRLVDVGPLLERGALDDAAEALAEGEAALARDGTPSDRGDWHAYAAQVALARGDRVGAAREEAVALRCRYEAGAPEAVLHHYNLAELGAPGRVALAHRLAASVLAIALEAPMAIALLRALGRDRAALGPDTPPPDTLAALTAAVEADAGVSLAGLLGALGLDGEVALAAALGRPRPPAPPQGPLPDAVRQAVHAALLGLAEALAAGARPADVAPSVRGLRETIRQLDPRGEAALEGLVDQLLADPRALRDTLVAASPKA